MSFLDDIVDVGSSAWNWISGSSTSAGMARAAALGLMLREVQSSINKSNDASGTTTNPYANGAREQIDPSTDNTVPVVYGQAFIGAKIIDAVLSADNQTMWYAMVLCEQTGTLMSTGNPSVITVNEIYWNQSKVNFNTDGITAKSLSDESGNVSEDINGLVKFYVFSGDSTKPSSIGSVTTSNTLPAYSLFPNWTSSHMCRDLVFVLVRVEYNATKQITGLGSLEFKVNNTMTLPGDCINDYMTNAVYGAGIKPEEINSQ